MFAYKSMVFYFIKSLYGISNLESWKKYILLLAYIADASCFTNRSFYMRTLSLIMEIKINELKKRNDNLQNVM